MDVTALELKTQRALSYGVKRYRQARSPSGKFLRFLFQDVFLHEISVIGHAALAQTFLLVFIGYLDDRNLIHLPHCVKEHIKTSYLHFYHYKLSELSHSNVKMSMYTPE